MADGDYYEELVRVSDQLGDLGIAIIGIFIDEYKNKYPGYKFMWSEVYIHEIEKFINKNLIQYNIILEEEVLQVFSVKDRLCYIVRDVTYVITNPFI